MPDALFKSESVQDAESLGRYFEALRTGFAKGDLTFACGEERFAVHPSGLITFSLVAKAKGEDRKIKLTARWKEREPGCDDGERKLVILA